MLSIVSIHYNDPDLLLRSLHSVASQAGVGAEVVLVDNSSNFPGERLSGLSLPYQYIDPGYNSGFARGVNAGLKAAKGEYVLLLNQDATLPDTVTLKKCLETLSGLPQKTILGINLVDPQGNYQRSIWPDDPGLAKEWRTSPIYIRLTRHRQPEKEYHARLEQLHLRSGFVHRINGAFLLFHRSLIEDGLFWDEDFFLYGEDVEWACRCRRSGWRFYHFAGVQAVHEGSSASARNISVKQQQVIVSDWLAVRKMKGRVYMVMLLVLTAFNRTLDILLYSLARWRGDEALVEDSNSLQYALMQRHLVRKYGWILIYANKFSDSRAFKLNCYDNTSTK